MKVLVLGGVAAGTKIAAKLMREDRGNEVVVINKGANISYAGCGLPYYVGHVIEDRDQLIVNTPEKYSKLTGVTVLTETEAVKVDPEARKVVAKNVKTGEEQEHTYDKLVVSVGASPVKPPIEGCDLENVFFVRTPEDAIKIRDIVDAGNIKRAVVVGAGYIGLEIAENLKLQGVPRDGRICGRQAAGKRDSGCDRGCSNWPGRGWQGRKSHHQQEGLQGRPGSLKRRHPPQYRIFGREWP